MADTFTGPATTAGPLDELTRHLRDYFNNNALVPVADPWSRLMRGFLFRMHIYKCRTTVQLSASDFGMPDDEYTKLGLSWGTINLLPDDAHAALAANAVALRRLPTKHGTRVHWGVYVPMDAVDEHGNTAVDRLLAEYADLLAERESLISDWLDNYERYYQHARVKMQELAARAWVARAAWSDGTGLVQFDKAQRDDMATKLRAGQIDQIELDPVQYADFLSFVNGMTDAKMATYPTPDAIMEGFRVEYEQAYIPMPAAAAEQAAHVAEVQRAALARLEAEQRAAELAAYEHETERLQALQRLDLEQHKAAERLRIMEEHESTLRAKLEREARKVEAAFLTTFTTELRQVLHESLMFTLEGVNRGRLSPMAGQSLASTIDAVRLQCLGDDLELQQLLDRCSAVTGKGIKPSEIASDVQDVATLLQAAILAAGQEPRTPRRMRAAPFDIGEHIGGDASAVVPALRKARERLHLSATLGEALIDEGETVATLRQRRTLAIDE